MLIHIKGFQIEKFENMMMKNEHIFKHPKKVNPRADTSALEAEIDRLVYELYGLTDEEIRIVEESVAN